MGEFEEAGRSFNPEDDPSVVRMLRAGLLCNDAEITLKSGVLLNQSHSTPITGMSECRPSAAIWISPEINPP